MPSSEERQRKSALAIAALITVFLWASAFPGVRYILNYYSAQSVMVLRFIVASAALGIMLRVKKARLPGKKDIPMFALAGFVGIFLYMLLFNIGVAMVPSGVSSFLISSAPVYTTLLSVLILKERPSMFCWAGIFISLCGLVIITASQMRGFVINIGVVLLLGASISTSLYFILQRKLMREYTPLEATAYPIFFGTLFMLIFLPGAVRDMPGVPVSANLLMVYLGVFPAAISYLSWGYALSKAKSTANAMMFLYLVPFVATVLAFVWLGETFSPFAFLGGIVIIGGMVVSNRWG